MEEKIISDARILVLAQDIRNFHQVTDWLYRGGQPGHDGLNLLARAGIKTILSLRWGSKTIGAEKAAVETLGMKFISIPMYYWRLPDLELIEHFFSIVDDKSNWPLFVHCFHGADRTGLLLAIFRIKRQEWHVDDAYVEMKRLGFHRFRIRHFKWHLYQYARSLD